MAALIEAIALKRKMFFELENVPYHCPNAQSCATHTPVRNLFQRQS